MYRDTVHSLKYKLHTTQHTVHSAIQVNVQGYTARRYAFSLLSLTRVGLDRLRVARTMWESCAIPACLYGVESICIGTTTVKNLEKIQTMRGNFILQVPGSTSKVARWMDAGLVPMKYRMYN